jgi:hypothetical protein
VSTVLMRDCAIGVADLTLPLQPIARNYLAARQRGGEGLLEMAALLTEARARAKYGEWNTFLTAIDTSADVAERLLLIHRQAMRDPHFADAVRSEWFSFSVAALLARSSTPAVVISSALSAPTPPPARSVQAAIIRAKRGDDNGVLFTDTRVSLPLPRPVGIRSLPDAVRWAYVAGAIAWDEAQELLNEQRDAALLILEEIERIDRWFAAQQERGHAA